MEGALLLIAASVFTGKLAKEGRNGGQRTNPFPEPSPASGISRNKGREEKLPRPLSQIQSLS